MKVFALRFDIDTPKCLAEGVPPLIDLAEAHGVRFSFYLTVGRSVSIPNFLAARFSGKAGEPSAAALSARQKLGWRDYLYTALVNPKIGPTFRNIVHRLAASQELGLHGGRNHELWHHQSPTWSHEKTKDEVQWAVDWLRKEGFPVKGFSSPGWTSPPDLAQVLAEAGFKYRADRHGEGAVGCVQEGPLLNVGTNFTGEPGGVAYFEHHRALGRSDTEILTAFERRLDESATEYAVVYDHPFHAGLKELSVIERILQLVSRKGFTIRTLGEIADASRERAA